MVKLHRILVATDFSDPAEHALEHALALAKAFDATVTLLHAFYTAPVVAGDGLYVPLPIDAWERDARRDLDATIARARKTWPRVDGIFAIGEPRSTILAQIAAREPDLVVMGTHGRSGLSRWLLGSVAERVVRTSKSPVLTVHARAQGVSTQSTTGLNSRPGAP